VLLGRPLGIEVENRRIFEKQKGKIVADLAVQSKPQRQAKPQDLRITRCNRNVSKLFLGVSPKPRPVVVLAKAIQRQSLHVKPIFN
jgi:ribosomal protein L15E